MKTRYSVWFTNVIGCAVGISDISLLVDVDAESESEAIELALVQARLVNDQTGLPPHGIRVDEQYLRTLAVASPTDIA